MNFFWRLIEGKYWNVLNEANLVRAGLYQSKNDYGDEKVIFYGLFLVPKMKYVLNTNGFGLLQEFKTFKGFRDGKRLLDRSQFFENDRK